jgi:hypothetical protein
LAAASFSAAAAASASAAARKAASAMASLVDFDVEDGGGMVAVVGVGFVGRGIVGGEMSSSSSMKDFFLGFGSSGESGSGVYGT